MKPLEIHCETEFNKLRATAFSKRNILRRTMTQAEAQRETFIYRENDDVGNEIISIMFEMKNENDETATKKKK